MSSSKNTIVFVAAALLSVGTDAPLARSASASDPAAKTPDGDVTRDPTKAPADVAGPPSEALRTSSGLAYRVLAHGPKAGEKATRWDSVKVDYTGWTTDGKMFDSSITRGVPASFPLDKVIPGWTEGLQLMKPGDRFRFWIPEDLAYKGQGSAPAGMLVFDVELLAVIAGNRPLPAPADVAAAPAAAKRTDSGLAFKVLKAGAGPKPRAGSTVKVHYTGWTTNGEMFDSSVVRGAPAEFPLDRVIAGWTEGMQLVAVGGKIRLWIPEPLAYQGRAGFPPGMLVFDVELLSIK